MYFFWKLLSIYRLKHNKEEIGSIHERFGIASENAINSLIEYKKQQTKENKDIKIAWVHAVSVGESMSVIGFAEELCKNGWFVVFTTTTTTSAKIIKNKLPQNVVHQYSIYPYSKYVKNFLNTWQPNKAFFVESEIFPNIIKILKRKNINTYLLNARMSNRSFNRWKKIKFYIKRILLKYDFIFTASEEEQKKFMLLTDNQAKAKCFGNLKVQASIDAKNKIIEEFNKEKPSAVVAKCKLFQQQCGNRKIIIFGSPHEEEFFYLIWQSSMLIKKINCICIFVPRYVEECYKLKELATKNDLLVTIWSDFYGGEIGNIVIVDTMGILMHLYNICDIAVVCGNFVKNIGGHNPFEPIVFNKPTIVGEHCDKCQDIVNTLLYEKALIQSMTLFNEIKKIILYKDKRDILIEGCKSFLHKNNNVLKKILEQIII